MKLIFRLLISYIFIGHFINFGIGPYLSPEFEVYKLKDYLIFLHAIIFIFGIFFMWGYLFRHWGMSDFIRKKIKRAWFWVILIGGIAYFVGPIIYYVCVFEMKKGLKHSG